MVDLTEMYHAIVQLIESKADEPWVGELMKFWKRYGRISILYILILLDSEAPGLALGNPSKCRRRAHDPTSSDSEDDLAGFDGEDPSESDQHPSSPTPDHASHAGGRHLRGQSADHDDLYNDDVGGAGHMSSGSNDVGKSSLLLPWGLLQFLDSHQHDEQEHHPTTPLSTPPSSPRRREPSATPAPPQARPRGGPTHAHPPGRGTQGRGRPGRPGRQGQRLA